MSARAARTARRMAAFLRDEERGSATIWNLFWLTGFGMLLGLGIDTTAAMNVKARLQTVVDAAAHAAVMDLFPVADEALDVAVAFALQNDDDHEGVVTDTDVAVGYWDAESATFETDDVPYLNAVRVVATRDGARSNALATTFLRLVGLGHWDIAAVSTAVFIDDLSLVDRCRKSGMFAGGTMEQTANNVVIGEYCLHGEQGVKITENNYIECGVEISLPDPSLWLANAVPTPSGNMSECDTNYEDLDNDDMVEQVVIYRSIRSHAQLEFDTVKAMLEAYLQHGEAINDAFNAIPPYIDYVQHIDATDFNKLASKGDLEPGTLYRVTCSGGGKGLTLSGTVQNIGIYTDCAIDVKKGGGSGSGQGGKDDGDDGDGDGDEATAEGLPANYTCDQALDAGYVPYQTMFDTAAGETYRDGVSVDPTAEECGMAPGASGLWDNVFLFTTSTETIKFPNSMQLGRFDGCAEGGGVRLYTAGDIHSPSGIMMHGSHFIVLGDVTIAAKGAAYGVVIEAAGNIEYSAQAEFSGCAAEEEALASDVVITVRPIAIVN